MDWDTAETRTITKEDGTTAEIYIPKEIAEDDLFQQGISSGINFNKFDKIPVSYIPVDRIHAFKQFKFPSRFRDFSV